MILKASKGKTYNETKDFILSSIISPFGMPRCVSLDGELSTELSRDFQLFFDKQGIIKVTSGAYSPHSLGRVERQVARTKETVRKLKFSENEEGSDLIAIVNSTVN